MSADEVFHFPPDLLYSAASLYYLEDVNQAAIADRLGTSRATVSRMLAEARRSGIVQIEVVRAQQDDTASLAARTAEVLGLDAVHLAPAVRGDTIGPSLAPALSVALRAVGLEPGDVLLVSSGRTVYEVTQADLPALPGVELAPMIGGQSEPQAWYATNEIVRQFAEKVRGRPTFLYAPALPEPALHATLMADPSIKRVLEMWGTARCAVMGVGPPPLSRDSIPDFVPLESTSLREAVGDVCSRFYDRDGAPIDFPGVDRMISTRLEDVREIPVSIAVAVGADKILSLVAGATAGYFTQLVTDTTTASALVDHVERDRA